MDTSPWCLELTSVDVGHELKGSLTGRVSGESGSAATKLALTVTRRDAFRWHPFLALLLGLVVGALAVLVPRTLRAYVKRVVLGRMVAKNRSAPDASKIQDLSDWVKAQLEAGMSAAALAPVVASMVEDGTPKARKARTELRDALNGAAHLAGHPLIEAARPHGQDGTHNVSDFLDSNGKPIPHPAGVWKGPSSVS